jgi:ABC-2 type transport system permease protein
LRPSAGRAIISILRTELRRRLADRSIIVSGFVAPAVIAAIIGFAFGAAGNPQPVKLGIAFDAPTASAKSVVDAAIGGAGLGNLVQVVTVKDAATLRRDVSDGTIGAGVIVPSGFASAESFGISSSGSNADKRAPAPATAKNGVISDLLANVTIGTGHGPPSAQVSVVAESTTSVNGALAEALAASVSSRLYAGALALETNGGSPGGSGGSAPLSRAQVAAFESKALAAAKAELQLDLTSLNIGTNHAVIGYYGSSISIVFLFIGAGLGTRAIAMERTGGTLTRLAAAPVSSTAIVVGKMLAVFVTAVVGLLVLWAETVLLFHATWGGAGGVILMCTAVSLAMCSLAMFLTSLAKNEDQAYAASIIVGIVLGIVGGNFFPPGSLPGALQVVSQLTPNGWALVGFGRLALQGVGISGLISPLVVLGIISAVFIALAGTRIRRVVEL